MSGTRDAIEYAKRHGGVVSTRELTDQVGIPTSTLRRRVDDGIFVRIGRGILALPGTSTRPDALMRAAGRLMGAVVSHQSAARLHGIGRFRVTEPTVTVHHRGTYSFPGLVVHQSTDLMPEHVVRIDGMSVTSPERTIIDLAKVVGARRLAETVDQSLAAGVVDFERLAILFRALSRRGKKGMRVLSKIIEDRSDDEPVPESVLEYRFVQLLDGSGLPHPTRQFNAPWLDAIQGRVDFAYVSAQVVIEADSRRWHRLSAAFEADRRRDMAAQMEGWIVLRFTWEMIENDPRYVVQTVRTALLKRDPAFSR